MRRPCGIVSAMKRVPACVATLVIAAAVARGAPYEPFPPKGAYNNSVHRYFPDLDARLNAVRYGRWRALEVAWREGIDRRLDARFSADLLELLKDPPRFAPEAERVAPGFARTFLLRGDGFSKEMDINSASPDVVLPLLPQWSAVTAIASITAVLDHG